MWVDCTDSKMQKIAIINIVIFGWSLSMIALADWRSELIGRRDF